MCARTAVDRMAIPDVMSASAFRFPETMITPATLADEPAIRACAEAAYAHYVPRIGRKPAPMLADYAAQIRDGMVHVAKSDHGTLLGFAVFYPQGDGMHLENVAVMPATMGRGIGKALIAFCEERARQMGLATVVLYTNEKMTENIAIYARLGYTVTARRTEDGFNRVYFQKDMKGA